MLVMKLILVALFVVVGLPSYVLGAAFGFAVGSFRIGKAMAYSHTADELWHR